MRGCGRERDLDAGLAGVDLEILEQPANPFRAAVVEDPIQGLEPLPGLDRVDGLGRGVSCSRVAHIDP